MLCPAPDRDATACRLRAGRAPLPSRPVDCIKAIANLFHQSWGPRIERRQGKNMPQMCQQFWPCSAVPPEYLWLMPIIMPLLAIVLLGVPVASILHRAGRSRWWTLIVFIPLLNLIGLWVFAFSRWPTVDRSST